VSAGGPDLFLICKSCGSEVSPYITECPYCGSRLQKRAPKLQRPGASKSPPRRRPSSLPRLRPGEIPGIRPDARPYATIVLVVLGLIGCLLWRSALVNLVELAVVGKPWAHAWRILTAAFTYDNTGYAFVTLAAVALYGWLLEHRHGPVAVILLFLLGGVGGIAATAALDTVPIVAGAGGGALALLVAWALPDLLSLRAREEIDGDLLGTAMIALVLVLMPLVASEASWIADAVGVLAGLALGLSLARLTRR
jgi:membrane associated rhomboid family serine protease